MSNVENVSPQVLRGVVRELQRLAANPPAGVKLVLHDNDLTDVVAHIDGPAGTPYAGGVFRVRLVLGREFPAAPPRAYFLTKIFHPNVSRAGEVCVNTLKKDWRPELGLEHVLLAVKCLLIAPNAESALNAEAGALLLERYDDYFSRAKLLTDIHARPPPAGATPTATATATDLTDAKRTQKEAGAGGDEAAREKTSVEAGAAEGSGRGGAGGAGGGGGEEGPCAKRERRPAPHKQPPAKDKRRILKRL